VYYRISTHQNGLKCLDSSNVAHPPISAKEL
jgi:hypothetical protein